MSGISTDPFDLARFLEAQSSSYERALSELKAGEKRTHWIWFIFPRVAGLGFSTMAQRYAIRSRPEAEAYVAHAVLGSRLRECVDALLAVEGRSAKQIMGDPDFRKLQSSITLFDAVAPEEKRFAQLLAKYYGEQRDLRTLEFLSTSVESRLEG